MAGLEPVGRHGGSTAFLLVLLPCLDLRAGSFECNPPVLFSYRLAGCVVPGARLALLSLPVDGGHCLWVYWSALHLGEPSLQCR